MRPVVLVLALVAGCRWNFDEIGVDDAARIDVPLGHDEDGDGISDTTDPCPHVAGDQADRDGDGVGDLCDPFPDTAGEQLVLFDPLTDGDGFTVVSATWEETGDGVRCDASSEFCELKRPLAFDHGVIEIGVDIAVHVDTAPQHQISTSVYDAVFEPYYYVEVYENGDSAGYTAVSAFDGTTYTPIAMRAMTGGVHTGRLRLQYAAAPPAPTVTVAASWTPETYSADAQAPTYAGGSYLGVSMQGVIADVAYVVVIAAP